MSDENQVSLCLLYITVHLILPQNWYVSCSSVRKCGLLDVFYSEDF